MLLRFEDPAALLRNHGSSASWWFWRWPRSLWVQMATGFRWRRLQALQEVVWHNTVSKGRAQTQSYSKVPSTQMPPSCAFCLACGVCLFSHVSPEEWQCERWLLWQTDCRLSLAYLCLTAELGPRVTHLWEGVMAPIAVLLKSSLNDWNGSWPSLFLGCSGFGIGQTGLWVLSSAFVTTKTSEVVTGGAGGSQPPPSTEVSGVWGEFSTVLCLSQKKKKNPEMYLCISSWLFFFSPKLGKHIKTLTAFAP